MWMRRAYFDVIRLIEDGRADGVANKKVERSLLPYLRTANHSTLLKKVCSNLGSNELGSQARGSELPFRLIGNKQDGERSSHSGQSH